MHLKKVKLASIGHPFPAVRVSKNKTVRQKFCSESCVETQEESEDYWQIRLIISYLPVSRYDELWLPLAERRKLKNVFKPSLGF